MNAITRRNLVKALLGGVVQTAATIVLARAVPRADAGESTPDEDVLARADRLAEGLPPSADNQEFVAFRNGGFANGAFKNGAAPPLSGGTAFRNGGFANGGGGAFRNGGFANGGGGGAFRNSRFRN